MTSVTMAFGIYHQKNVPQGKKRLVIGSIPPTSTTCHQRNAGMLMAMVSVTIGVAVSKKNKKKEEADE